MLVRVLQMLLGFVLACVAAAVTLVAFVYAPTDMAGLREQLTGDRLSEAGLFVLFIIPHVLISAAFPALLAAIFGETRKVVNWLFYALAGIVIALAGFLVQYLTEAPTRMSIFQAYALIAFLAAGLIGGIVYWAASGRYTAKAP